MSLQARRGLHTLGAFILAAVACQHGADVVEQVTSLTVQGVVEDEQSTPVAAAIVTAGWWPGPCADLTQSPSDTTESDGLFSVSEALWGTFSQACVRVSVLPPPGRDLVSAGVQFDRVKLDPKRGPDSLAIRVTLHTTP